MSHFLLQFPRLLRLEFSFTNWPVLPSALPLLVLLRMLVMGRFGLFHGYWRYTGVSDALDVQKAVGLSSLAFVLLERWVIGEKRFPLSVCFINMLLTVGILIGIRVFSRTLMQRLERTATVAAPKRVVVIGAGCAGAMLLRELPRSGYLPVALVDDDPKKFGARLHGVKVVGTVKDVPQVVREFRPNELLIATPSATGEQMNRIFEACDQAKVRFRTIPSLGELIHGTVTVDQLRDVNFDDLLGREPVHLDVASVRRRIQGRVVMVTGAAGSIGSELCRQLLKYSPRKLVCLDQAETPLFNLQNSLSGSLQNRPTNGASDVVYRVADITDSTRMRNLLREHGVQVIFHAAAYKHVPLMEENLEEALKNNVFGLLALMEVADQAGCEDFLLISSDKAVNPTSFMGCTKRIGELMIASRPSRMRCLSVRFGNVLGSQGSVIPLFQEQIRLKRKITVTHPDIMRYFMTISEAVSLVLQAFSIGEKRDILVLDMGKPVRIVDLAKTLIRLSGIPQNEIKIVFTGLRPGEKLFEELFYKFEQRLNTNAQKVFRSQGKISTWANLFQDLSELRAESVSGMPDRIRAKVREIIPQYQWAPKYNNVALPFSPLEQSQVRYQEPLRITHATD